MVDSSANGSMQQRDAASNYVATIRAALDIAKVQLLTLLAELAACAMFGYAVYDPAPIRTITAGTFAAVVLVPLVWTLGKRG